MSIAGLEMDSGATLRFMLDTPLTVEGDVRVAGVVLEAEDHAAFKRSSGWKTLLVAHGGVISGSPSVPGACRVNVADVEGGQALQVRYFRGFSIKIH